MVLALQPTPTFLWYLATPYTAHEHGKKHAYKDACFIAASLMDAGAAIFCPIAHGHRIARYMTREQTHELWMDIDRPFMERCDGLILAELPGWKRSRGMEEEFRFFRAAGKKIVNLAQCYTAREGLRTFAEQLHRESIQQSGWEPTLTPHIPWK